MGNQERPKNFTIKAILVASLCALGLLVAQNASLNSQVSILQKELSLLAAADDSSFNEKQESINDKTNLRNLKKVVLPGSIVEVDDIEDEPTSDFVKETTPQKRKNRSRKLSKGSKSGKSSKSSKRSRDCSSSRTNDSSNDILTAECEDLRDQMFALSTELNDLEAETIKFNALGDELQQTLMIAGADDSNNRLRKLEGDGEVTEIKYGEELQDTVRLLQNQKNILKTGNERVGELNTEIRSAAFSWIALNGDLTEEKLALLKNITGLTEENLKLMAEQSRLNQQINVLSATIDDYKTILDRHDELNGELNSTTIALEEQIDRLEAQNAEYKRLNEELNGSIDDLKEQNTALAEQNAILAGLNQDLNATNDRLNESVDRLEGQVDRLGDQNSALEDQIDRLQTETDRLNEVNGLLGENVEDLKSEVDRFVNKTERLEKLNDELQNIVSFINETKSDVDQTMEAVTEYLSDQIVAYRSVATKTLKNTFIQRADLWDCAFADHFRDQGFASNGNTPIPANMLDEVFEYVGERVLEESCLSLNDFKDFLNIKFPTDPPFSKNHIVSGIAQYTYLAYDYYFPDKGEAGGLIEEDWALAGYDCEGLPQDKRFLHSET